jgi:ketose-bisphosphate aldolase
MPLVRMTTLLRHAREHGYAVGYFESWNLESLLAVKDAAERMHSPVIIGFNGGFLGRSDRRVKEDIGIYGNLGRAVAEASQVPMALILNEATDPALLRDGLAAGFNVVMHDHEGSSLEESIRINVALVEDAHDVGAEVEAEIGELPAGRGIGTGKSHGMKTDPGEALRFIAETGIDALAVSVGNIHVLEGRTSSLDFELLAELLRRVPVPLVLHGGTGIDRVDLKEAIHRGVCKINVGTVLRRRFVNSIRQFYETREVDSLDPGELTSTGGDNDMLCAARAEVAVEVEHLMTLFGSVNQSERIEHV